MSFIYHSCILLSFVSEMYSFMSMQACFIIERLNLGTSTKSLKNGIA